MEYFSSPAIILKKTEYKDFKYIVHFLSANNGIFTAEVTLNNYIQPPHINILNICQIIALKTKQQKISIKEIKPVYIYKTLFTNIKKNITAQFIIEILTKTLSENYSDEKLFQFVKEHLIQLDTSNENQLKYFHLIFLKEYISILGITPLDNYSPKNIYFNLKDGKFTHYQNSPIILSKEESYLVYQIFHQDNTDLSTLPVLSCTHILLQYLQYHYSANVVHSLNMLKDMVIEVEI